MNSLLNYCQQANTARAPLDSSKSEDISEHLRELGKVKAVFHPYLLQYKNIVIFPIKGKRSLASMLGGGDYDGDTAQIIWQPEIVGPFRNADERYASPPPMLMDDLHKEDRPLDELVGMKLKPEEFSKELMPYLLAGLQDTSLVGIYSNWHLTSVYKNGFFHPESIRLAWM